MRPLTKEKEDTNALKRDETNHLSTFLLLSRRKKVVTAPKSIKYMCDANPNRMLSCCLKLNNKNEMGRKFNRSLEWLSREESSRYLWKMSNAVKQIKV